MALFFNNGCINFRNNRNNNFMFNNFQNNNRFMQNNMQNNRFIQPLQNNNPNMQQMLNNNENNIPSDVTLQPLTEEEFEKINEEIRENIEKNKNMVVNIQKPQNTDLICNYIEEFIQDETNANIFYNNLSNRCNSSLYKDRLKNISDDCFLECSNLKSYYKEINEKNFEPKQVNINVNMPFKEGLYLAIEEEIKSYDKLCKIIEELPPQDTRVFYKMALKKLSRINTIQYMIMNERS